MALCSRALRPRSASEVAGALLGKLSSTNPKTAALAVGIADALAKNGEGHVHVAMAEAGVGAALSRIAARDKSRGHGRSALELLHQLGTAYASCSAPPLSSFASALESARAAGCEIPASAPEGVEARALEASAAGGDAVPARGGGQTPERLLEQLGRVMGWVADGARMLRRGGGASAAGESASAREERLDLVDVLEQCEERLLVIIEAGMGGALQHDACLGGALEAQAAVAEVLPWLRGDTPADPARVEAMCGADDPASPVAAAAAAATLARSGSGDDDLGSLFGGAEPAAAAASAPATAAAAAAPDPFAAPPVLAAADSGGSFDPRAGDETAHSGPRNSESETAAASPAAAGGDDFDPRADAPASEPAADGDLAAFEDFLDQQSSSDKP